MTRKAALLVLGAVSTLQVTLLVGVALVLASKSVPLGVPGEWVWNHLPAGVVQTALQIGIGIICVSIYAIFAVIGFLVLRTPRPVMEGVAVASLLVMTILTQYLVALSAPDGYGLAKWAIALGNKGSSGYFDVALQHVHDPSEFLARYPTWIQTQDALHIGTHPPGLFLIPLGTLYWLESNPPATRAILNTTPTAVMDALTVIEGRRPLNGAGRATIVVNAALILLFCSTTVVPLYMLVRAYGTPSAAWASAGLWALVPAANMFQPLADTAFPLLSTTALALAAWSLRSSKWAALGLAFASGLVLSVGMMFSLVFLPVGALVACVILLDRSVSRSFRASLFFSVGFGFLGATLLFWVISKANPFPIWLWNQRHHSRFYEQFPKSRLAWTLVNTVELSIAMGLPASVWALLGLFQRERTSWLPLATVALLAVLTLSGRSLSEVARLWLPFMPFLLAAGGTAIARLGKVEGSFALGSTVALGGIQTLVLQASIQVVYPI